MDPTVILFLLLYGLPSVGLIAWMIYEFIRTERLIAAISADRRRYEYEDTEHAKVMAEMEAENEALSARMMEAHADFKLHPPMGEKYSDCRDMLVLAHAVGEAAENAAQNIAYLQGKKTP